MEKGKKKLKNSKTSITKKTTKKPIKKKVVKKKRGLAFTLIELLAVIVILGILMLVAIPSVTNYINNSRKSAYIDTANQYIKGVTVLVNSGALDVYDTNVTYYIPSTCVALETGGESPYGGKFSPAYVLVTYNNDSYNYYWMSRDANGIGIKKPTQANKLKVDVIESGIKELDITPSIGIDGRTTIVEFTSDCSSKKDPVPNSSMVTEDGTEIVSPVSFATDAWDTIAYAVKTNNTSVYNVGDTRPIDLGSYGAHTLRLANKSSDANCTNSTFSKTACGFVVEFADIITNEKMNLVRNQNHNDSDPGGWANSDLRTLLNGTVYNSLPSDLKPHIIDTYTVSGLGLRISYATISSTDKLYLLNTKEIGITTNLDAANNYTRTLDYYAAHNNAQGRYKTTNVDDWWLRSVFKNSNNDFYIIYSGWDYYRTETSIYGVSPAFRIG